MNRFRATAAAVGAVALVGLAAPAFAGASLPGFVSDTPNDSAPIVLGGQCYGKVGSTTGADPNKCRRVLVLHQTGSWIYAGGIIDTVEDRSGGSTKTITGFHNIFRYDASSLAVDSSWQPQLYRSAQTGDALQYKDSAVTGLDGNSTAIYAAGAFTQVATIPGATPTARHGVAALDPTTGAVLAYNARSNALVKDVKIVGSNVWIGGTFTKLGTKTQPAIAFTDPKTGALVGTQIAISGQVTTTTPTKVTKMAISNDGTQAAVIGNYTTVGGVTHNEVFVASITNGIGTPTSFDSPAFAASNSTNCKDTDTWARGVDWSPDNIHFDIAASGGGGFDAYGAAGALCDALSRFDSTKGSSTVPDFVNETGYDSLFTVTDTGPVLYTGGHNKSLNHALYQNGVKIKAPQEFHYGIGAVDTSTGKAITSFNSGTTTGRGAGWAASLSTATGVYIGGDAQAVGTDTTVQRLAYFPASP